MISDAYPERQLTALCGLCVLPLVFCSTWLECGEEFDPGCGTGDLVLLLERMNPKPEELLSLAFTLEEYRNAQPPFDSGRLMELAETLLRKCITFLERLDRLDIVRRNVWPGYSLAVLGAQKAGSMRLRRQDFPDISGAQGGTVR